MTKAEYNRLYSEARKVFPRITLASMRILKRSYIEAAKQLSEKILQAQKKGLSEITTQSWASIEAQLTESAAELQIAIDARVKSAVRVAAPRFSRIHERYLFDVIKESGGKITHAGITNMFVALNKRVVESVVNRIFQDGYTFSDRVWKAASAYGDSMKRLITSGLAQGRDLIEIAKDIQVYVRKDKAAIIKRYGDLRAGTADFVKRIRGSVDYNALRLLRSELYASMQDAARWSGQYNPGCSGLYDWLRGGTQDWGCECPAYADGGPYTLDSLPDYPHPNCLCRIQPRLRDYREFISNLQSWVAGGRVYYMDEWYKNYYTIYA